MTSPFYTPKIYLAFTLALTVNAVTSSPNIIFIVADDLGWNDVGYHNPEIYSPNIDQLASAGIVLNQSYVQPVCSPSRTAFMTGVYPFRLGLQHLVIGERQEVCVPLNQTFFPQVLQKNGYKTHAIGKWHLGFCKWECTPTYRGFDSFYGFYSGGEDHYSKMFPTGYDFRFNESVATDAKGTYSSYQFADRAEDIIRSHNSSDPLYVYMAFQSVHMPLQVPESYLARYANITNRNRRILSAMVTALDDAIGHVVSALKEKNLYDDTIIVFTSDNGGWTTYGGNNYPLRGGKLTIFEGGTRVPAFIHSPMLNKGGTTYPGMMHAVDWFPTLAEAAGISYTDPNQDGVSQWKPITSGGPSNRNEFVYNMDFHTQPAEGSVAIRVGDYKLVTGFPGIYKGWYKPHDKYQGTAISLQTLMNQLYSTNANTSLNNTSFGLGQSYKYLFNLRDDPTEHVNLYDQLPDVVSKLEEKLAQERKRYVTPNFPANDPEADPKNFGGNWSPGWC